MHEKKTKRKKKDYRRFTETRLTTGYAQIKQKKKQKKIVY